MAATMRSAMRIIDVELQPNVSYQVRGILLDGKDDGWLEVLGTNERVGAVVSSQ